MKQLVLTLILTLTVMAILTACDSGSNSNANRSNTGSSMGNAANTVSNTAANAANTVANAVSGVTTPGPDSFLKEAAQGGMAEVELGKLAAQKAKNPEVKKFGQMMVEDHTKANNELKELAGKKNIAIPADLGSHQSDVDSLKNKSAADFDSDYVDAMVDDHESDVSAFQKQADNATDPEVKAFAAKTLPVLKKHLEAIKAIQAKMTGGNNNGNGNSNSKMKH